MKKTNELAWNRYLGLSLYDNDEETFFHNIYQLKPGEAATFCSKQGLKKYNYYNLSSVDKVKKYNKNESLSLFRHALKKTINIHTNSDVPLGISLSGGFDSSALLTGLSLNKYLNKNVKSFSVDFAPYFSEKYWIKIATEHHGINAFLNSFKPKNFLDSLKPMMWHLEGPIGGLMNCALSVVMSKAKENNITVLLGGMGLDEVFAGYRNMHNIYIRELINNNSPKAQKALADYSNVNLIDKNLAKEQILKQKLGGISTIDGTNPINNKVLSDSVINYVSDINSTNTHYSDIHNMMINYLQESKIPRRE